MNSPPPPIPKLPSRRVGAALATAVLGVGIALGALIGPGPAAALAGSSRASAVARVLALLALGSGTSAGSELALSPNSPPATTPQPTPSASEASAAGGAPGAGVTHAATSGSGASSSGASSGSGASRSPSSSPSTSPTSSTTPAKGGEGEDEMKGKPLPPIADVWLIELPYGVSVESALKQSAAAPYIDGQLKGEGTALSGYSPLAAAQLAGAAALLSGQVNASVTTVTPPLCTSAPSASTGQPPPAGQPSATGQSASSTPCPAGEPAGVQAANAFLQETLPAILASAPYSEHGLIAITFTTSASATAGAAVAYPAGTLTGTFAASGTPAGALLLSPFLRHPGTTSASAFNPLVPRESLAALLTTTHH